MEVLSKHKYVRISPQKCRLVADQIRGLPVERALNILRFSKKRAALLLKKTLDTAIVYAQWCGRRNGNNSISMTQSSYNSAKIRLL